MTPKEGKEFIAKLAFAALALSLKKALEGHQEEAEYQGLLASQLCDVSELLNALEQQDAKAIGDLLRPPKQEG
jgi:hypothetical protein